MAPLPILVLIHPFPFSAEIFESNAAALAGSAHVLTPSMRGFGGAPPFDTETAPSIDAMADDVARLLDDEGLPTSQGSAARVIVGGVSMGGYIALAFARRHPARLRGLILSDTRAEADSDEARAGREAGIQRISGGDAAGWAAEAITKQLSAKTQSDRPEVVERTRGLALAARAPSLVDALRAMRDRPDARPGLAAIDVPTLLLVGKDDAITPPSAAEAMHAAIRGSKLVVIPDAAHLPNLENPDAWNAAVEAFVRG